MEILLLARMKKRLLIPILCILPLSAMAETLFVSDTLRVGIRPEPNSSLPSLTIATSGTKLELLEKKGSYAKVRTDTGIEGWVKSAYLSKQKPYRAQYKEAQQQINELKTQLTQVQKNQIDEESKQMQQTISDLQKDNKALLEQVQSLKSKTTQFNSAKATNNNQLTLNLRESSSNLIYIALGVITVILILGFMFGVSWHKKQVTKRLGGLSI